MNEAFKKIMGYSPENEKVFKELSALCTNKMIVPYIGAGLSVFAGFKTWNDFINEEYERCFNEKKLDSLNNIVAADKIEQKRGKEIFYENVRITFGGNLTEDKWKVILKEAEKQAISIIPKLFYGPIVTTNFDQIIEKIHNNNLPVVFPYHLEDLEKAVNNRKRILYKIHGCVSDPQKIVFAKNIYDKVYSPDSYLVKSISRFLQGFQFLFLGCSLGVANTKGDTKDYSMDLWEKLQNSGTYHFAILACTKDQLTARRKELEERNIHPILFESGKFGSIKIILDELLLRNDERLFKIPQYDSKYIEREDSIIAKIEDKLKDKTFSSCAITGFGGVGKTRVMSEYARKVEVSGTKVFWFNAISADSVRMEINQFLLQEKLNAENEKDIFQIFKNWMIENENWLFLLDNVENYEDIKVFIDIDNTLKGKRHILLTSRKENEIPNIQVIDEVKTFNKKDSLKFLETHTKKPTDKYADKIAILLDGLPLALEQASAYIREENESYEKYFELLEKEPLSILEKKHPEPGAVSVAATWNISMQRIKSKAAKEFLNLCAFFASDNIYSQWFVEAIDVLPDELWKNNLSDFVEIKKDLKTYSLVRVDSAERISIHRLLQEVVKKTLKKEQIIWIDTCVNILDKLLDSDFSTTKLRPEFNCLFEHIQSVVKHMPTKTIEILKLYHYISYRFNQLPDYPQALKWYKKALNFCVKVLGKNHPDTATTYHAMAEVYKDIGDYNKALDCLEKSLDIRKYVLSKYHPKTAATYRNLGTVYEKKKDYAKALKCNKQALSICEKNLRKDYVSMAEGYNNIAVVYMDKEDYNKALKYFRKTLDISEKGLHKDHLNAATVYNNIALAYFYKKDYDMALYHNMTCLEIGENVLGKDHPLLAITYNNIAMIYNDKGDYDTALDWYLKTLPIRIKVFGKKHHFTKDTYDKMKRTYQNCNKPETFEEWTEKNLPEPFGKCNNEN